MLHLVLCFSVWTVVTALLFWRLIAIAKQGVNHLKRLHQIPCDNCAYFTGDYRLKCTVNPTIAMSETAIGCRDFIHKQGTRHNNNPKINNPKITCGGCLAMKKCSHTTIKREYSMNLDSLDAQVNQRTTAI